MYKKNKNSKIFKKIILFDVYLTYLICIIVGFVATFIYYLYTKHFSYMTGWLIPTPFVLSGMLLQQLIPDLLLKKARDYGEYAEKPKGFMFLSSILYISSYLFYVVPFIIIWAVSLSKNVSYTSNTGWFNIYFAIGSTFLILLLVFVVKLIKNYYNNKNNKDS